MNFREMVGEEMYRQGKDPVAFQAAYDKFEFPENEVFALRALAELKNLPVPAEQGK